MGRISQQLFALVLAALLALGVAACGGSGDSPSSTAGSTVTSTRETTAAPTADHGSDKSGGDQGASDDSSAKGSAAFRTPGGDNSIQNFGDEADAAEAAAATAALSGYLAALARGDWAKSCAGLAKDAVAPLEQLASSSAQLKGKGCAAILAALEGRAPVSTRVSTLTGPIASLRVEGERAFALYHGAHGVDYFVPMVKEGGDWKVGALAPSEFP